MTARRQRRRSEEMRLQAVGMSFRIQERQPTTCYCRFLGFPTAYIRLPRSRVQAPLLIFDEAILVIFSNRRRA